MSFPLVFWGTKKNPNTRMVEIYIFVPTGPARPGKQPSYLWSSGGKLPRVNVVYCILEVIVLARGPQKNRTGHPPGGFLFRKSVDPTRNMTFPEKLRGHVFFFWGGGGRGVNLGLGAKS